ncbi:MAG: MBL fold metallo-hydrolase, partial [Acidimicrobiales bacterium]
VFMCGVHDSDGTPIGHHHGPIFRPRPRSRSRRAFLGQFGRGTLAMAVFTPLVAACSSDSETTSDEPESDSTTADDNAGSSGETSTTAAEDQETPAPGTEGDDALQWRRANLGFVSAYVLARGNAAAVVDTGTAGSAAAIGETLQSLSLTYDDVDHLILTHKHGDHVGSMAEVVAEATSAAVYAGEADLGGIDDAPLGGDSIVGLVGGEDVFGFEVVATPGHTAGHMSLIDHTTGLLIAGDAIFTEGGGVVEGPERFFEDVPQSRQTIRDLAELSFNTLLVGHGDPIETNADTAVADLAASLP